MTIKQALKEKNRLIKAIEDEFKKVYAYNSIDEGNVRPYSTVDSLSNIMTELKSLAKKLNQIDCSEGKVSDRYSRTEPSIKTAELSIVERDVRVKSIEEEIERLQEELDTHNATTSI